MKTDDLIHLLSQDTVRVRPLSRLMWTALGFGIVVPALVLALTIGTRHDLAAAILTWRVQAKIAVTLLAAFTSCFLLFRVGRPGVPMRLQSTSLLLPVLVLFAAAAVELWIVPPDLWGQHLVGRNAPFCLFFIPVLSAAPLVLFLRALREGAPGSPALAGAVAGLASGTIAASLYAWHCPDDSPLFVATWYVIAIAAVVAVGTAAGRRTLAW